MNQIQRKAIIELWKIADEECAILIAKNSPSANSYNERLNKIEETIKGVLK